MTQPSPDRTRGSAGGRARERIAVGAIILLALLAYSPVVRNGLVWDDDVHIAKQSLHSLDGLKLIWTDPAATQQYYPLAHTAFWLQWLAWGERPLGYHIVNVLLHVLNAILFWRVLKRLDVPGAILAAAVFAVHPVHVESVAWITELKNTLMGAFTLSSLLAYLRFRPLDEGDGEIERASRPSRWGWYALATLLYVAALLSKTVAAALPAAILVIIWWKRGRLDLRRDVLPVVPWLAIGAGLGLLIAHFERVYWGSGPENFGGEFFTWTPAQRILVAGWSLWFYVDKLFWPHPLAFFYRRWRIDPSDWTQWLWPAAAVGLVLILFLLRRRIGRGPLAAALLFGGSLLPALGFINLFWQIYSYVADHMQYLPSMSVFALAAAGLATAADRLSPALRAVGIAFSAIIVCGLAFLTWDRCHAYRDLESLYKDTIVKSPDSWLSNYNLGIVMAEQGDLAEAERRYRDAIEIRPNYDDARYNLANILAARGGAHARAEALSLYAFAIDAWAKQVEAQRAIAAKCAAEGQAVRAARHESFAAMIDAKRARGVYNRGNVERDLGRVDDAIASYRLAAQIDPAYGDPMNNLGSLCLELGRRSEALDAYRAAVKADPSHLAARFNLGSTLAAAGDSLQAEVELRQALRLAMDERPSGSGPRMINNVKAVAQDAAKRGRHADAARYYDVVLEAAPDDFAAKAERDREARLSGEG